MCFTSSQDKSSVNAPAHDRVRRVLAGTTGTHRFDAYAMTHPASERGARMRHSAPTTSRAMLIRALPIVSTSSTQERRPEPSVQSYTSCNAMEQEYADKIARSRSKSVCNAMISKARRKFRRRCWPRSRTQRTASESEPSEPFLGPHSGCSNLGPAVDETPILGIPERSTPVRASSSAVITRIRVVRSRRLCRH